MCPSSGVSGVDGRVWHRMEEREVSQHCLGTSGIGILEGPLETLLLHRHWHSQGRCGQQLLEGEHDGFVWTGAIADMLVHWRAQRITLGVTVTILRPLRTIEIEEWSNLLFL